MRWRRFLAGAATLAGALAPFAGSPYRGAHGAGAGRGDEARGAGERDVAGTARPVAGYAAPPSTELLADPPAPPARATRSLVEPPAGVTMADTGRAVAPRATIDVAELARAVADEEDHVSAVELAEWLRARRPGLRVIDVRTASEFAAYHIPGAEHVPLEQLAATRFADGETIVVYSEMGVHGGQAWVFLRALGHRHVVFLRNGLHEWLDDVMSPTIAADARPAAQAAFDRVAELSRYFGGTPRRLAAATTAAVSDGPAVAPTTARRRGC